jgi:hypothetical protein
MKLTYRLVALVALMLVVNVRVQAQQKEESRVDKLVRAHGDSHEEHDRACHGRSGLLRGFWARLPRK